MTSAPPAEPAFAPEPAPAFASGPAVPEPVAAPDPPQGPGVYPPFPAPPVEGKGLRIGLGLGIGAAVALLVCGGGVAAVIGLAVSGSGALNEQATVVVGKYFTALEQLKYDDAYGMLCADEQQRQSQSEFRASEQVAAQIKSHDVGKIDLTSVDLTVPVAVTYTDGQSATLEVLLDQSPDTGQFQVCGVQE